MNLTSHLKKFKNKAQQISLNYKEKNFRVVVMRDGNIDHVDFSQDCGVRAESMINGQFGYACTDTLTDDSIKGCIEESIKMSQVSSQHRLFDFSKNKRPSYKKNFPSKYKKPFDKFDLEHTISVLQKIDNILKVSDKIFARSVSVQIIQQIEKVANTNGLDSSYDNMIVKVAGTVYAKNETGVQYRSFSVCKQVGLELLDEPIVIERAKNAVKEVLELLDAPECPTGRMDVIMYPDQLILQLHESIGHPLEIDRILGDERNYAGFSFVKPENFGVLKYGSEKLNVVHDPTVPEEILSTPWDDTGTLNSREYLIEKGVLKRGIGGKDSQIRSGLKGISTMRASEWNRPPIDRMGNINIEPGNSTLEEMIKSVEYGVIMKSNKSWSIDDYRRKFQFGTEYGLLIEKGKITKVVKNPNYRDETDKFWHRLDMVGDRDTFEVLGVLNCGKGEPNQGVYVGHATPICLFRNVDVFGGC